MFFPDCLRRVMPDDACRRTRSWAVLVAAVMFLGVSGCVRTSAPLQVVPSSKSVTDQAPVRLAGEPSSDELAGDAAQPLLSEGSLGATIGNYLAGRFAYGEHDYRSAADYFERALADDPENPALLRAALRMQLAAGRFDAALDVARDAGALDPLDAIAQLTLVADDAVHEKFTVAAERLGPLSRDGVYRLILPVVEAWLHYGQSGVDAALTQLASLKTTPSFRVFYEFNAALLSDLADRPADAQAHFEAALAEIGTDSLRLVIAAGSFYERNGQIEQARALYESYVASRSASTWLDDTFERLDTGRTPDRLIETVADGIAETLYGTAGVLPQQPQDETGVIFVRLALQLRPEFPSAHILLGEFFEALDRPNEAVEAYRAVQPSASGAWPVRIRIAVNRDRLGDTDDAVRILTVMANERPEQTDAWIALGDILRASERFAEAVDAYDAAIERETDIRPEHWTLFYTRGVSLERSRRWADAERDFLKALELEPDQPFVLNYLGYSWIERGERLDEAQGMIERAVALRPSDGYIVDSLGWAYYRQGEFAKAVIELERAIELQPDDPTINDHLGDAYWQVGRRNEARFQWERAMLFDEAGELAETLKDKLENGLDGLTTSDATL